MEKRQDVETDFKAPRRRNIADLACDLDLARKVAEAMCTGDQRLTADFFVWLDPALRAFNLHQTRGNADVVEEAVARFCADVVAKDILGGFRGETFQLRSYLFKILNHKIADLTRRPRRLLPLASQLGRSEETQRTAYALRHPRACAYDKGRVIFYALGRLLPDQTPEVREHIKSCWGCLDLVITTRGAIK